MDDFGQRRVSGALAALVGSGGGDTFITLNNGSVTSSGNGVRTATFRLGSDGVVYHGDNGSYSASYTWCNAPGDPADYEARATFDSGDMPSGTLGSWLALTANRDWSVSDSIADGPTFAVIIVEIRNAITQVVLDSATINLTAERIT